MTEQTINEKQVIQTEKKNIFHDTFAKFDKKKMSFNHTPHGNRFESVYSEVFDEDKKVKLVKETDKTDIYEYIQASNNMTDIAMLREQMIRTGVIPAIDPDMVSADVSFIPKDIHELHHVINNIDETYNGLPEEVRNSFGSRDAFLNSLVDGTYQNKIIKHYEELEKKKVEVNVDETK